MRVSVVIPVLNERLGVTKAIRSAWDAGADEVIVVDGGSTDGTVELIGHAECQLLVSHPGRATQMNIGAKAGTGDVILFQHADNWLDIGIVTQIREALADPKILCGAFRQRIDSPQWAYRALEWGNARRVSWLGLPYGDQGIFVRKSIFDQLGGFPGVPIMEDYLLMRKLKRLSRPALLFGPIYVSPRRWQQFGIVRQTLRNWSLVIAYHLGVAPARLSRFYRRHEQ